jgi:hypothetical protein
MRTLQKFVAVHGSVHNHFDQERHLYSRSNFKLNLAAALTGGSGLTDRACWRTRTGSHLSNSALNLGDSLGEYRKQEEGNASFP